MSLQTQAIIYLAAQRTCIQSESFWSYPTLAWGKFGQYAQHPFPYLRAFYDNTLKPTAIQTYTVEEDSWVFLLPVVGGLEYQINEHNSQFLDVGESCLLHLNQGTHLKIHNPYAEEAINFILSRFSGDKISEGLCIRSSFDLDEKKNLPLHIFSRPNFGGYLGKFTGREDLVFTLHESSQGLYAFVIEGVFELQNRLLQPRDGLAILGVEKVEMEALSQEAILLIFEF